MTAPRFEILDIVETRNDPRLAEAGLNGTRGVVSEIREYPGPRLRYMVRNTDEDGDVVSAIFEEEDLLRTGVRASADIFGLPGGFREREIVRVSETYADPELAGRTGVVEGGYNGDGDLGVWIEELGESVSVPPQFLTPTGDRLPAQEAGRTVVSTRVGVDGEIKGHTTFIMVDEVSRYL
jgi:hypothetical protein